MLKMRTIKQASQELKEADSKTAVTEHFIRQLIINNKVPYVKAGGKYLINMDALIDYLSGKSQFENNLQEKADIKAMPNVNTNTNTNTKPYAYTSVKGIRPVC